MITVKVDKERFTLARANAALTVAAVLEKAKLNHKIGDKISGGKNVSPVTVGRLAKVLNVSVEYLLGR